MEYWLEETSLKNSVLSCPSVIKFLQALGHGKMFNNCVSVKSIGRGVDTFPI